MFGLLKVGWDEKIKVLLNALDKVEDDIKKIEIKENITPIIKKKK